MHRRARVLVAVVAASGVVMAGGSVLAANAQPAEAWVLVATPIVNELESGSRSVPYTSFGAPLGAFTQNVTSNFASGQFSYDVEFEFVRSPDWKARDSMSAMMTPSRVKGRGGAAFNWTVPPSTIPADGSVEMSVTVHLKPQEFVKEPAGSNTSWLPMALPNEPSWMTYLAIGTSRGHSAGGLGVREAGTKSVQLRPPPAGTATTWEITVSVTAFGRASITYRYEWGQPPQQAGKGKLPCKQALQLYGLANTPTGMRFDVEDLRRQFGDAIDRWQDESHRQAFISAPRDGTLPAIAWLANQGGLTDDINKRFVLTTDADRQQIEQGRYRDDAVPWGTERRLYLEIAAESDRLKRKLTPGDVFYLALKQRGGDAREACLLAHNTLRTLARVSANPITGKGDLDYTLIQHDEEFIQNRLQPLIDNPPLGRGQNTGAWYHMFGVAYFEMQSRGHMAGSGELVQAFGGGSLDELNLALNEIMKTADDMTLAEPDRRSALSRLANEVEQHVRKRIFGSPDDPLKYCYNIWGAEVGGWLYDTRLPVTSRPTIIVPSHHPRSPWGSGVLASMIRTTRELGKQGAAKVRATAWKIRMLISGSPVNITWTGGGHTMRLDQATQNLYGAYPVHLLPIWHESSGTWGVLWVDVNDEAADVMFEATDEGAHHLIITDGSGGEPRLYTVPVQKGDRFTVNVGPSGATQLTRFNGTVVPELTGNRVAPPPSGVAPQPPQATPPSGQMPPWEPGPAQLDLITDATRQLTAQQIQELHHALLMLSLDTGVEVAVVFVPPISREQAARDCGLWRDHLIAHGVLPHDSALLLYGGDARGYSRSPQVDATLPLGHIKQAWEDSGGRPDLPSRVAAQLRRIRELVSGE